MKQATRHFLIAVGIAAGLALAPDSASANDRQQCLNDCIQKGADQTKQCRVDADKEMVRCGQLATNEDRNKCKREANDALKRCNEDARLQVKKCKEGCPPKK
jgi:gas vesicle protein